jgi:mannose-6-phosphate isomerase class I
LAPFRFPALPNAENTVRRELLAACRYFAAERLTWSGESVYEPDPTRFHLLIFLAGRGELAGDAWKQAGYQPGDGYLIPAECEAFHLRAQSPTVAIRGYVPDLRRLREELETSGAPREKFEPLLMA